MAKKNKNKRLLIGITIFVITIASIFSLVYFGDDAEGTTLSISLSPEDLPDNVPLDFCTSEDSCYSYLSLEGMPDGFLETKGYTINCQNGNCYFNKI